MKKPYAAKLSIIGALLSLCASTGTIHGQYVVTGTTPGGGNIIVGSGTSLPALGPGAPLSAGGFNMVTLNPGSNAFGTTQDPVTFNTSGNTVVNYGTIFGGVGTGRNGLSFQGVTITGETVNNFGNIIGGSGTAFNSGVGLLFTGQTVGNLTITGPGSITGGNGFFNTGTNGTPAGAALHAGGTTLFNVTVNVTGPVTGGNGGPGAVGFAGGSGGAGFEFGSQTITNINIHAATAAGGNGGAGGGLGGGFGGDAVVFTTGSLSNVSLVFTGNVNGGTGGLEQGGGSAGQGGHAFNLSVGQSINISVVGTNAIGGDGGLSVAGNGGSGASAINTGGGVVTNQSLVFSGIVQGGNGGNNGTFDGAGGSGGNGLELGAGTINTFSFQAQSALGGNGGSGTIGSSQFGGIGVDIHAGTLNNITIVVPGNIAGGAGGAGTVAGSQSGNGGRGLDIEGGAFGGIISVNAGNITGGVGGSGTAGDGGTGGNGIYVSTNTLSGVVMNFTGNVTGGNGGNGGTATSCSAGPGGIGIQMGASQINGVSLSGVNVTGGNGGQGTGLGGGSGGVGIMMSSGLIQNVNLKFSGNITGGNGGSDSAGGSLSPGGNGMDFGATTIANDVFVLGGVVGGNGANSSTIANTAANGGDGANFHAGAINNVTFVLSGNSSGGNGGTSTNAGTGGNGGNGLIFTGGGFTNLTLSNTGSILGGNAGVGSVASGTAGNGIVFGPAPATNVVVNNGGYITGGNAGPVGVAGMAIFSQSGGVTINNLGSISAGSGASSATQVGFPPIAISVQGNNNTINLKGHSSVNGTIQGTGANNVLNLVFTGVNPAALASLKAQLATQGYPANAAAFTGTFTLRNVTYFVDPLILNIGGITSYEGQALTPNQFAIGVSLDSALVNPAPGTPLFNLFNAIDQSGNVPLALEALSPQRYEVYGDLAIQNSTALVQDVDARLNNVRNGSESIDTTGVGGASDAPVTAGFSKEDSKSSKEVVQPAEEKRWGFFAAGDGLFFRGGVQGRADTAGTIAGVDAKVGDHGIIGALFAYDNADATLGGAGGHATIESYSGGLYGAWHNDGFYVNGLAAYTRNHYSSNRSILFPGFAGTAAGTTDGNQYTANIDGGYDWRLNDSLSLGPIAGLQYVHLDVDSFNEAGAVPLSIGSQSMDSLQSRLGGRLDYRIHTSAASSAAVNLHAAWQHEFMDDSRGIGAGFQGFGLAPFSVQTSQPRRDAGVVGLGVNFTFHDRLTLFTDYELIYWRSNVFEQTINGGARISF